MKLTPDGLVLIVVLAAFIRTTPVYADDYFGLQLGRSHASDLFNHARFAFPDLAQGGPGCCDMTTSEERDSPAARFMLGKRFENWGVEWSFAWLGTRDVAFDVSGPFGSPEPGRCVESGKFRFWGTSLSGNYRFKRGDFEIAPSFGLSGNWADYDTTSHCKFTTHSVQVDREDRRFSMSPVYGVVLRWKSLRVDFEHREVALSHNAESKSYGQGDVQLNAVWLGLERRF